MWENKQESQLQAALLWKIIPSKFHSSIAGFLSNHDLNVLQGSCGDYLKIDKLTKQKIDKKLSLFLQARAPVWPIVFTLSSIPICLLLFFIHSFLYPSLTQRLQIEVFSVFLIGIISPLLIYFLPWYKRKTLFQMHFRFEYISYAFFIYLALIWLLVEINQYNLGYTVLPTFTICLLLVGVICAPLFEEIVFRELLPSLLGREPYFIGQLISALLFTAAHFPDSLDMFLLYFIASALLGVLRILSGGLIYGLIVHSLANSIVVLL